MLEFHMGASLNPGCSTSNPADLPEKVLEDGPATHAIEQKKFWILT